MRHAGFGDGVVAPLVRPLNAATEPMVTMRPRRPLHHFVCHGLTGRDHAERISVQHRADIFLANTNRIVRVRLAALGRDIAPGIVDEDIDRSQALHRRFDDPRDVRSQRQIAEDADGAYTMIFRHGFGDRGQRRSLSIFRRVVLTHAVDRDMGTLETR